MILILSGAEDEHVPLVTRELNKLGASYLWFDPEAYPEKAYLTYRITQDGEAEWMLGIHEHEYNLMQVTAVWDRRPNVPTPHAALQDPSLRNWVELSCRHVLEGVWDSLDCLWVPAKPV